MEFAASGGGGGAPINASYLVLGADGILTSERVFTPGTTLAAIDGGAGGAYTLDLKGVAGVAGSYTYAALTVDAYGRVTVASSGAAPLTSLTVDAGELTNTGSATAPVLGLATTGVGVGTYNYASITVDAFGRVTGASSGAAPVTSVSVDAGELTSTGGTTPTLGLANAGTAGTYAYPASVTTDGFGRVTGVTAGTAPVTAHTGLSALGWASSGHTGASTSVAAFDAGGAAQNVSATADGQVLTRVGGVLVFAAVAATASVFVDSTKTLEIIYLAPLEIPLSPGLSSAVGPGVFA